MIARSRAFVVPVCLDATTQAAADVPESFQRVQWTPLPGGETPPAFVERIKRLLSPERSPASAVSGAAPAIREPVRASRRSQPVLLASVAVVVGSAGVLPRQSVLDPHTREPRDGGPRRRAAHRLQPPPHSIAVLPFVNLSADKEQEYFSDGLTEELLNSLAENQRVAGRRSHLAFSFKGQDNDIGMIARKLNVAPCSKGASGAPRTPSASPRSFINAVTGFHLWSKTYDRDLGDVLNCSLRSRRRWRVP